jgi:hypothetical protein
MAKLFFSYCHADEALRDRLEKHLSLMRNQGLIETWHDRGITAGDPVDAAIDANLESADVILLLISADFLASVYCYSIEMKRALARQVEGSARVIPVILKPCDWHSAPFGKLLAVPKDGKAVTTWANEEEAWADVTKQVRSAVEKLSRPDAMAADTSGLRELAENMSDVGTRGVPVAHSAPRSSNLRVTKQFTDYDKDKFLHDTFDFMGKFFQSSLDELTSRNLGIQTRFHLIDGDRFSAIAYRDGKSVAECSVSMGGYGRGSTMLTFCYEANAGRGTSNEMLSVESDNQNLFFKPLMMQSFGGQQDKQLSQQGAAEHFWSMFMERLQR